MNWIWDEFQHAGTDYSSPEEVRVYDQRMAQVRDVAAENRAKLKILDLAPDASVIEIGCGTGAFALAAAPVVRKVIAVDVSRLMLDCAAGKAAAAGLLNIEFHAGGFLTYQHSSESVDAVVSSLALHHLPDAWKAVALDRVAAMLKPGGKFLLTDVVFGFEQDVEARLEALVRDCQPSIQHEFARHVGQEYSTFDWIMRGLLERAGFEIQSTESPSNWLAQYLCVKRTVPAG